MRAPVNVSLTWDAGAVLRTCRGSLQHSRGLGERHVMWKTGLNEAKPPLRLFDWKALNGARRHFLTRPVLWTRVVSSRSAPRGGGRWRIRSAVPMTRAVLGGGAHTALQPEVMPRTTYFITGILVPPTWLVSYLLMPFAHGYFIVQPGQTTWAF